MPKTNGGMKGESVTWDWRFWMVQFITLCRLVLSIAFPFVGLTCRPETALGVYVVAIASDLADGALARRWKCATRGGDWLDAFADRMLTTMSGAYGFLIGAPTLACSLIIARDLAAASVNELRPEDPTRRSRFLGIITVTPIRVVTLYILALNCLGLPLRGTSLLYWLSAAVAWATFAVNAWLRRGILAERFKEPDREKLLR